MNIGGGFSHESTNSGGGLSIYDDVGVCLSVSVHVILLSFMHVFI